MTEPRYTDDPFEDGDGDFEARKKPKKLFGNTELQRAALIATGRATHGFRDNQQLAKFKALEEYATGADDESRVWDAWIRHRTAQAVSINAKRHMIVITMDKLIHNIGLKSKREEWFTDNRATVLEKKTPAQIAGEIDPDMLARSNE